MALALVCPLPHFWGARNQAFISSFKYFIIFYSAIFDGEFSFPNVSLLPCLLPPIPAQNLCCSSNTKFCNSYMYHIITCIFFFAHDILSAECDSPPACLLLSG